ncbi:hypothetical protein GCM10023195_08710 [Actinoallomurus liliacearum]|uniref:Uncharacterized protein n=1 Tax=Actinoallomurus liliacearum TaxID=1080073 RepID=A0ABP8TAW8_9ACTN
MAAAHGDGASVTVSRKDLPEGAEVRIRPLAQTPQGIWPATGAVRRAVRIETTKGRLRGEATIRFDYPVGTRPEDLIVSAYDEDVRAWIPVPFDIDVKKRRLVVRTDHFSMWQVREGELPAVTEAQKFGNDVGKDAGRHQGDQFAGFFERLLPPTPDAKCENPTSELDVKVTDYGQPQAHPACTSIADRPGEVTLRVANTHLYPMLVALPKGVTVSEQLPEGDDFEEVMSQLIAQVLDTDSFVLWHKTKKTAGKAGKKAVSVGEQIFPAGLMIKQLRTIWSNPGLISEWTEGLVAGLSPGDAGRITITLTRNPFFADGTRFAYLRELETKPPVLLLDLIQFFDRNQNPAGECRKDGIDPDVNGGEMCHEYYIRDLHQELDAPLAKDVTCRIVPDNDIWPRTVPCSYLAQHVKNTDGNGRPYQVTVRDSRVVRIEELYTP